MSRTFGTVVGSHLFAFCGNVRWKAFTLPARSVFVTDTVEIKLTPNVGEFDLSAVFFRQLTYEREVFDFIESIHSKYDAILEIGANVGVFTCFLSQLAEGTSNNSRIIVSFEPSKTAYKRLCENLKNNSCTNVCTVNAAVSDMTDTVNFFEPDGHLTNGSISKEFAGIFSNRLMATHVLALGPEVFEKILSKYESVLIKVDAEGYEPKILEAWRTLIQTYRPDIIVEVLAETADSLACIVDELGYSARLISSRSPVAHPRVFADSEYRDWFLSRGCDS